MSDNPHDDLTELESAIHHLKEAQQLHNEDEYDLERQGDAVDKVDEAINAIGEYVEKESTRLLKNSAILSTEGESL